MGHVSCIGEDEIYSRVLLGNLKHKELLASIGVDSWII
jgi:hypothetical protein